MLCTTDPLWCAARWRQASAKRQLKRSGSKGKKSSLDLSAIELDPDGDAAAAPLTRGASRNCAGVAVA